MFELIIVLFISFAVFYAFRRWRLAKEFNAKLEGFLKEIDSFLVDFDGIFYHLRRRIHTRQLLRNHACIHDGSQQCGFQTAGEDGRTGKSHEGMLRQLFL